MPMMIGALIDAAGFTLLLPFAASSGYAAMLLPFALMPTGMGLGVPAGTTAVLESVDKARSGVASGALNGARQAGGAIGVALVRCHRDQRQGTYYGNYILDSLAVGNAT